jgi:23S rRNA (pseudouridine1915-N3)-methyltransferase
VDRIVEYVKCIGPYAKVQMLELPDDKAPESMSPAEEQEVCMKESNQWPL